jgi:hypothetical protein
MSKDYAVNGGICRRGPEGSPTHNDPSTDTSWESPYPARIRFDNSNNTPPAASTDFWATQGVFFRNSRVTVDIAGIPDGSSCTFLLLELAAQAPPLVIQDAYTSTGANPFVFVNHKDYGYAMSHQGADVARPNQMNGRHAHRTARGWHPGGIITVMADGAGKWVPDQIDVWLWHATFTRRAATRPAPPNPQPPNHQAGGGVRTVMDVR